MLVDFNTPLVWIVSTLISKSSSPCTNPFVIYRARQYQGLGTYLSFTFLQLYPVVGWFSFPLFPFYWLSLGLVFWPRLDDPSVSQNSKEFFVPFSRTNSGLRIYHLFVWSNLNFFTIPSGSPSSHSRFKSYTFFALLLYYFLRVFHISVSWWSFPGDWVTASVRLISTIL